MQVFGNVVRFGIYAPPHAYTFPDYLRLWQTAEKLGFDCGYLTDHLVTIGESRQGEAASIFESFTLLSSMASHTQRIRCGINVVGNTFRTPGLVAKMAATLDHVSNGRLELGLGASHYPVEHEQYDIPFYTTGRRLRMLGEAATMIRSLLTNEVTSFEGRYYKLDQAVAKPQPIQSRLPIIIGGVGEDLTLRVVAESADIWNVYLRLPREDHLHKLDVLRRHCEDVGRDPAEIRRSQIVAVFPAKSEALAKEKAASRSRSNPIAGTPEQVAEELLAYVRLGVSDFLCSLSNPVDYETLELLATEVAPIVRAEGAGILANGPS
jgi:alkanesulfonate monooxygenase SsuD/methylene tetrahydromethanopterin reductase-like flavin-dependent oxidoreductase (luciferase family)